MSERPAWDDQFAETEDERNARLRAKRLRKPPMCEGYGVNRSDPPSKLCPGCQAYREHQE